MKWLRPSYDCIVIGSGPGGYVAAIRAAQLGHEDRRGREGRHVGGRCLNEACIPAKAVLRVADVITEVQRGQELRHQVGRRRFDFGGAAKHRDKVIKTLTGGVAMLFKKNKIDVIEGHGARHRRRQRQGRRLVRRHEIEAGKVILATGSVAQPDPRPRVRRPRSLDTAAQWLLDEQPEAPGRDRRRRVGHRGRLRVRPAGHRGDPARGAATRSCRSRTRRSPRPRAREIGKQNVKIVTGANVENVDDTGDVGEDRLGGEDPRGSTTSASPPAAAPTSRALGLDDAGIETDERGLVKVDGALRTSREGVYAIGDLVPGPALAHKASDEGVIAVEDAAGLDTHPIDYGYVPRRDLLLPAGRQLRPDRGAGQGAGYDVVVGKVPMGAVGAPTVYGDRGGMVKIIGDKKYGELLGAPHRLRQGRRPDPGAGGGPRPRGRLPRGRPHRSTRTRRSPRPSWRPPAPPTAGSSTADVRAP